jgi:hypothetical protein
VRHFERTNPAPPRILFEKIELELQYGNEEKRHEIMHSAQVASSKWESRRKISSIWRKYTNDVSFYYNQQTGSSRARARARQPNNNNAAAAQVGVAIFSTNIHLHSCSYNTTQQWHNYFPHVTFSVFMTITMLTRRHIT